MRKILFTVFTKYETPRSRTAMTEHLKTWLGDFLETHSKKGLQKLSIPVAFKSTAYQPAWHHLPLILPVPEGSRSVASTLITFPACLPSSSAVPSTPLAGVLRPHAEFENLTNVLELTISILYGPARTHLPRT